mmetsp:Transcript_12951/g.41399  ORF Transcript_12951/g.41399 Transcript_12951/m.41399 type:complete len:227 (-) Transcript_12951:119-799(-)
MEGRRKCACERASAQASKHACCRGCSRSWNRPQRHGGGGAIAAPVPRRIVRPPYASGLPQLWSLRPRASPQANPQQCAPPGRPGVPQQPFGDELLHGHAEAPHAANDGVGLASLQAGSGRIASPRDKSSPREGPHQAAAGLCGGEVAHSWPPQCRRCVPVCCVGLLLLKSSSPRRARGQTQHLRLSERLSLRCAGIRLLSKAARCHFQLQLVIPPERQAVWHREVR